MKHRHPRPDIQALLEKRVRHGLTFRELSEESGIPIPTLSYYASQYRQEVESRVPGDRFVAVSVDDDVVSGAIAIELGPSVRVTVERGFDEAHLRRDCPATPAWKPLRAGPPSRASSPW